MNSIASTYCTTTQDVELFRIEGPAPGYDEHVNSYRSEAYGLLAGLNFLGLLIKTYGIELPQKRKLHVFSDNLSLVKCIQRIMADQTYPRMYICSDSDVILHISHDVKNLIESNIDIILNHVKGHQDDMIEYSDLLREAQLNVAADSYATNYINEGELILYDELPANPSNFYINDNIMNRDTKKEIRKASRSPELRTYMIKRFKWHHHTPELVWWTIHGSTIQSFSHADRRRLRKMMGSTSIR